MDGSSGKTFEIGFALSGAISAGAYTAGVLDYFFQALNAWEEAKQKDPDRTPQHKVNVQVIAGASAGAITGALGVVALARGFRPERLSEAEKAAAHPRETVGETQDIRCVLPSLYETWVVRPRMVDPGGGVDFLSAEDLDETTGGTSAAPANSARVVSALNSKLLDDIKNKALAASAAGDTALAEPPYPYIAENLHVYMTVSNLRGIPFEVSFGNSTYGMQTHSDRAHYIVSGLGTAGSASNQWLAEDSGEPIAIKTLPKTGQTLPVHWDQYGTSALASSAFPIGLAPRRIDSPFAYYALRSYPFEKGDATLRPKFPGKPPDPFAFLNVDGGVINNNPFDYAQYALLGNPKHAVGASGQASRAVLMVSPFPEPPAFLPEGQPAAELVAVIRALFPALINQARFKASELVPAMNPDDCSRFLIAPHRAPPGAGDQKYKIACGLLGGFGGFLDEKFRAHDFQLGRRNCQRFLETTFGLTPDNGIVAALAGDQRFKLSPEEYRVIPRLGDAWPEVPLPRWPRMSQQDFTRLMHRIDGRLNKVRPRFVQSQTPNGIMRLFLRFGLWWAQDKMLDYVKHVVLSDLVRRDQIEGWTLPTLPKELADLLAEAARPASAPDAPPSEPKRPSDTEVADNVRAVLAELVSPAFTYRTADGIAEKAHLPETFVRATLAELQKASSDEPYRLWRGTAADGREIFTLASNVKGFWSWPVARQFSERWLEEPTIDPPRRSESPTTPPGAG